MFMKMAANKIGIKDENVFTYSTTMEHFLDNVETGQFKLLFVIWNLECMFFFCLCSWVGRAWVWVGRAWVWVGRVCVLILVKINDLSHNIHMVLQASAISLLNFKFLISKCCVFICFSKHPAVNFSSHKTQTFFPGMTGLLHTAHLFTVQSLTRNWSTLHKTV